MSKLKLSHIADLHVQPADLVKLICRPEVLLTITNGELKILAETIDAEMSYRENKKWAN